MTREELKNWVSKARRGEQAVYFKGYLPVDKFNWYNYGGTWFTSDNEDVRGVANLAMHYYEQDAVHLVQRKLGDGCYEYIAVRA